MTVAIKQRAHELIEALPDDATWQDLLDRAETLWSRRAAECDYRLS
jgi:hypothetical protein